MTALIPQATASAPTDLNAILRQVATQKLAVSAQRPAEASNLVPVKKEAQEAISRLSDLLSSTELPSERRALTQAEAEAVMHLGSDSKAVKKAVETAVEYVKQAVFNHLDVLIEEAVDEDELIPYDEKTGHYLVAGEAEVPGTGKKFVRQLSEGEPTITASALKQLWDEGKISREQYYRATRKPEVPRVVDEDGLFELLRDHPEITSKLADVIEPGKVTASFWIRDVAAN